MNLEINCKLSVLGRSVNNLFQYDRIKMELWKLAWWMKHMFKNRSARFKDFEVLVLEKIEFILVVSFKKKAVNYPLKCVQFSAISRLIQQPNSEKPWKFQKFL